MTRLVGVGVSPGIARGTAYVLARQELTVVDRAAEQTAEEVERLRHAAAAAVAELQRVTESVRGRLGDEFAHIFRSQQTIAEDDAILGEVVEAIEEGGRCAEASLETVFGAYRALFDELSDDDYNKGRAADIDDVYRRILRNLLGLPEVSLATIQPGTVVVAEDLFPSDTAGMDPAAVAGMVTQGGGPTSHAAILANNLGIPAAVQVADLLAAVDSGDPLLIRNGDDGAAEIVVDPDPATLAAADAEARTVAARRAYLAGFRGAEPRTVDGTLVTLSANVGSTEELRPAVSAGATSVGLYRTEFLFLNTPTIPEEERQYRAYRAAVEACRDGFVVFRSLDIGGDKTLPALQLPHEDNPFLGNRALRLSLSRPELFRSQLRAILRASAHGPAKIMFPMVGGTPELDAALDRLDEARRSLEAEGTAFDHDLEVGIMIEVPSAILVADALAERVDFFSVGTNDLTQYLLAADRLNPAVAAYYRTFDPSLFRAIATAVDAASARNRWVGVCGELGGNPLAIPALLGLGVTELSMSARMLDEATAIVRRGTMESFRALAREVLALDSAAAIEARVREFRTTQEEQVGDG